MKCIAFIFNCGPLDILFQPRCIHKSTHAGCLFWHASLNRECVCVCVVVLLKMCCWRRCLLSTEDPLEPLSRHSNKTNYVTAFSIWFFFNYIKWRQQLRYEFDGMYGCVVVWRVGRRGCKNPLNKNVHWLVELLAAPYREKSCFYRLNKSCTTLQHFDWCRSITSLAVFLWRFRKSSNCVSSPKQTFWSIGQ